LSNIPQGQFAQIINPDGSREYIANVQDPYNQRAPVASPPACNDGVVTAPEVCDTLVTPTNPNGGCCQPGCLAFKPANTFCTGSKSDKCKQYVCQENGVCQTNVAPKTTLTSSLNKRKKTIWTVSGVACRTVAKAKLSTFATRAVDLTPGFTLFKRVVNKNATTGFVVDAIRQKLFCDANSRCTTNCRVQKAPFALTDGC